MIAMWLQLDKGKVCPNLQEAGVISGETIVIVSLINEQRLYLTQPDHN